MIRLRGLTPRMLWPALAAALLACGSKPPPADPSASSTDATSATATGAGGARVVSLAVAAESLTVDKVGGRDGALFPDGIRDLAFDVEVFGPISVIYVYTVDEHGDPDGVYRVNTLVGESEAPRSLGGTLEKGRFSAGLGVFEGSKLLNKADGSLEALSSGRHMLKLYTSNPGSIRPGMRIRAFAELPDRSIIKGPVVPVP